MTEQHPITPPPELADKWTAMLEYCDDIDVFTDVARWGADQELEACCEWLDRNNQWARCDIDELHDARRPKPQSLKEQALQALYRFDDTEGHDGLTQEQIAEDFAVIRRALEQLDD